MQHATACPHTPQSQPTAPPPPTPSARPKIVREEVAALANKIGIMVGGRLRCFGSAQELRSAHGSGFSLELRLAPAAGSADAAAARAALTPLLDADGALPAAALPAAARALGAPARADAVTAGGAGWAIHAAFASPARACAADVFCAWWAEEARAASAAAALAAAPALAAARLVERQGGLLKFAVPRAPGGTLADAFEALEVVRGACGAGTTATLCETSLEEIFNALAATQDEERGAARGLA